MGWLVNAAYFMCLELSAFSWFVYAEVVENKNILYDRRMFLLSSITVSVNLSREDLDRPDLCNKIDAMMARYGVSRDALHLEVTESAYVEDTQRVMGAVEELRSRGFIVEMDDFGNGYSSLNALKDIDIDKLKLDMRFLSGESGEKGRIIVRYIIGMAQALRLPIIAEGVETLEQAEMLRALGCSEMQGYYFSKPVPAEVYERLLRGDEKIATL